MIKIEHTGNETDCYFLAKESDSPAGKIYYTLEGTSKVVIQHTTVYPEFKGKNIGTKLVMEVVEFARKQGLKIFPVCPFAEKVFDKTPSIWDVLV